MLKSGALGVAGALGIGTAAKDRQIHKAETKAKFAAMSSGAPMASAAASAGSGMGGAEAAALGAGVGASLKPRGIIPALKRAKGGMQTLSKSLFGKGGDKMEARAKIKAKTTDKLRKGFRKLGDKLTFRDVRKRHGGGNSMIDKKRDALHKAQDNKRALRSDSKEKLMNIRRKQKDYLNQQLHDGRSKKEVKALKKQFTADYKKANQDNKKNVLDQYFDEKNTSFETINKDHVKRKY